MKVYINKIKRINDQLYIKNIQLFNKIIFVWIIDNLIEKYEDFVTIITQIIKINNNKTLNLIQFFVNLMNENKRIIIRNNEFVLYVQKNNKFNKLNKYRVEKSQKKCFFCEKNNHKTGKCWFKYSKLRFKFKKNKTFVITKKKIAMFVINTFININEKLNFDVTEYNNLVYSTSNANCEFAYHIKINRFRFILNFDATIHVCCKKSYFREIKSCNNTVLWNKISRIKAFDINFVSIIFNNTNQKTILQNCLYVSKFQINLISIHKLFKNYKIIFDNYCHIYTKNS